MSRCAYLFIALLAMALLQPVLEDDVLERALFTSGFVGVLLVAVWRLEKRQGIRHLLLTLGINTFLASWLPYVMEEQYIWGFRVCNMLVYFIVASYIMLRYAMKAKVVNRDHLFAIASVYVLLAVIWTAVYAFLELAIPGSFNISGGKGEGMASQLTYFSFATLTTTGYGDITPSNGIARSLSMMEAICGVLFVALMVARLVSLYQTQGTSNSSTSVETSE